MIAPEELGLDDRPGHLPVLGLESKEIPVMFFSLHKIIHLAPVRLQNILAQEFELIGKTVHLLFPPNYHSIIGYYALLVHV